MFFFSNIAENHKMGAGHCEVFLLLTFNNKYAKHYIKKQRTYKSPKMFKIVTLSYNFSIVFPISAAISASCGPTSVS